MSLKNSEGKWIDEENELRSLVTNFFEDLYSAGNKEDPNLNIVRNFPHIDAARRDSLAELPSNEEIRRAIFAMGPYKAPEIDGYCPIFYQKNWSIVEQSLCNFVRDIFTGNVSLADSNKTLLALIPNRERPESVTHFRPIALCTVHYKCIAKILTLRIRSLIDEIISPFQVRFMIILLLGKNCFIL